MMEHDSLLLAKLEAAKEVRTKALELEKLKSMIIQEVECSDQEDKNIQDYKKEMDSLVQEKMAHVEELRQIHADINAMENVIKKAEEAKNRSIERAKRIYEDYRPLKDDIDRIRRIYLGMENLPELHEEEKDLIPPELFASRSFFDKPFKAANPWCQSLNSSSSALTSFGPPVTSAPPPPPSVSIASAFLPHVPPPPPPLHLMPSTIITRGMGVCVFCWFYRQQPPPMKSCLSCHQQIHRNAPICPLCKAKSRSRNPKKPKKKT
ncbi:hypothetical protein M8J76_001031 [Diaphorina citri]|nr:hypothetical protein M8J75_006962 [Diaphorina citri]KAI5726347.1 hypothetical protein M8J76_001031 [Diaphorina citri]